MKRLAIFLAVSISCSCGLSAGATVVLVRGTVSTPNAAERNYANRLTILLGRWMTDIGLSYEVVDDEDISGALDSARLVILGYNPNPPAREISALTHFVKRNGKLMVFYSSSRELASLMQMRLGEYMSAPLGERWSSFRFNSAAPPHASGTIRQESRNIRPVYPAGTKTKIIAHWLNAAGETAPEPAWVRSEHGLWMSHVLLDDGDTERKKAMLLAMIAAYLPDAWRQAAEHSVHSVCRFGNTNGFESLAAQIRSELSNTGNRPEIADLLDEAEKLHRDLPRMLTRRRFTETLAATRRIDRLVLEAYARLQDPRPTEFRGIWDHTGMGLYPGKWEKTCRILASNGITDILSNMAGAGAADYRSGVVPESDIYTLHGDQLAQSIPAARNTGLRMHLWKICWNLTQASPEFRARMKKEGRLQVSDTGKTLNWLCPSNIENLKMEKDTIREIVDNYNVDGIHLDYIRYPDSHACYCPECHRNFEALLGYKLAHWPDDVRMPPLKDPFQRWRVEQITRFVRDVRAFLKAEHPSVKLSAAVYGRYPLCIASVGQDWGSWLHDDLVDFVCPMNYTEDLSRFDALVKMQTALPAAAGKIVPGIGVTAAESHLNAFQVVQQILRLRQANASGYVLFDLNPATGKDILPYLRMGIAAKEQR